MRRIWSAACAASVAISVATAAHGAVFTGTLTGDFNVNLLDGVFIDPGARVEFSGDLSGASGLFLTLVEEVFRLPPDYAGETYETYIGLSHLLTSDGFFAVLLKTTECCSIVTRPEGLFLEGQTDTPIEYEVSIAEVPEPTTWALLIAGFGGVGGMLRRRNRALAA
jgi:hypothetical protein